MDCPHVNPKRRISVAILCQAVIFSLTYGKYACFDKITAFRVLLASSVFG